MKAQSSKSTQKANGIQVAANMRADNIKSQRPELTGPAVIGVSYKFYSHVAA